MRSRQAAVLAAALAAVASAAAAAGRAAHATPPNIDLKPTFGDALVPGRWQPLTVTLENPADGDALTGGVEVVLEDPYTEQPLAAFRRDVSLPRGAATAETTVHVLVPEGTAPPELRVNVVRAGSEDVVTRRRFDRIPSRPGALRLLCVAPAPDALAYLDGERLSVYHDAGGLLPALDATTPGTQPGTGAPPGAASPVPGGRATAPAVAATAAPVQTIPMTEPGRLPDRAAAYDAVAAVYLGDVPPEAFSDAQVAALRGYVLGGGVLIVGGERLRRDERFRRLAPPPTAPGGGAGGGGGASWRRVGRGRVATLPADAGTAAFGARPDAVRYWQRLLAGGVTAPRLGAYLESASSWYASSFADAPLFAPGMRAPSAAWFGGFMAAYLLLVSPVNYFALKRLGRREWTWFTVPALVALFSFGAYRLGFATKGTELYQNVTSLVELGPGGGDATVVGYVGLFSPRRTAYDVRVETGGALLFEPQGRRRFAGGGSPGGDAPSFGVTTVDEDGGPGSTARGAGISMWAMRVFGVRTGAVTLGDGVRILVRRDGNRLVGTVENRTKRPLEDAVLFGDGGKQNLGTLAPGQSVSVRYAADTDAEMLRVESPLAESARRGRQSANRDLPREERLRAAMRDRMAYSLNQILEEVRVREAAGRAAARRRGDALPPPEVTLAAWNGDALLPVRVDGKEVTRGAHLNLVLVRAPIESGE